jgi:hypothetical protein
MKTDLQKIVSIPGYPGLYRHLAQNKNGMIVESLIDGKRMSTLPSMRASTLADVAIYTNTEEMALCDVLVKIKERQAGAPAIPHKSPEAELRQFFEEIIPEYDRERFYPSHMKKVLEWYNLLQKNNLLDIERDEEEKEPEKENDHEMEENKANDDAGR